MASQKCCRCRYITTTAPPRQRRGGAVVYNPENNPTYTRAEIEAIEKQYSGKVSILRRQDEMWDITKLEKFYNIINPLEVYSELIVYDLENRDAGTTDNIFFIKGGIYEINKKPLELEEGYYVVDVKSGKTIGDTARMQVAAYVKMCMVGGIEVGKDKMRGGLIAHTGSTTKTGIEGFNLIYMPMDEVESEYEDYRKISDIWEKKFGSMKPRIFAFPSIVSLKTEAQTKEAQDGDKL